MSSWTFYLLQENNEKLSVPVQFTLFLNFIVVAPSLSLAPPVPGLTTAQDDGWRRVISEQIFFATPWNVFLLFVRVSC